MCFAPQRRALFRQLNCQKWSEPLVFCTFWLGNVLRATTACKFSSLLWPAGSAPAALASLLFDPPEPQIIGKTLFRDFPTFSRICIFCPLTLSLLIFSLLIFLFSLPLPCSAFHLSILSEVWLLNFLRPEGICVDYLDMYVDYLDMCVELSNRLCISSSSSVWPHGPHDGAVGPGVREYVWRPYISTHIISMNICGVSYIIYHISFIIYQISNIIYIYIYICMCVCICICIYVYMYICIYVYMYRCIDV